MIDPRDRSLAIRRLVPLQAAVSLIFAFIVAAVAGGLITYNDVQLRGLARAEAAEDFGDVTKNVREDISNAVRVAETVLDTATLTLDLRLPADRLQALMLALFAEIERSLPAATGFFLARGDGSVVQVQKLRGGPPPRLTGLVGDAATTAVLTVERRDGVSSESWTVLDRDGRELVVTPPERTSFDPRERPWWAPSLAATGSIVTRPYRFASVPEAGITIARRVREEETVLAIDITLTALDSLLARNRRPPALEPVIFDSVGGLVAHPNGVALRRGHGMGDRGRAGLDAAAHLPRLNEIGSPVVAAMGAAFAAIGLDLETSFTVDGRRYLARFERVGPTLGEYVIGVAAPYEALVAPSDQIRRSLLLISIPALLGALALVTLAARALAMPIRRTAGSLRELTDLHFGGAPLARSRLAEIDELGRAASTLELALANFVRYVPFSLVRGLVERRISPRLGGQRQPLTVLFSDVTGFTGLAETMDPDVLAEQTSRYFSAIGEELLTSGATIDKYIGDSVMAFWNAPEPQPDHVARGCRAALNAAHRVAALNAAFQAEGLRPMPTRFGLHTGEAVVGNIGSVDRMNYTAVGHVVNVASRIEGLNKRFGTTILVSEAVRLAAGGSFAFREIGEAVPAGATEPLLLHELVGEIGVADA